MVSKNSIPVRPPCASLWMWIPQNASLWEKNHLFLGNSLSNFAEILKALISAKSIILPPEKKIFSFWRFTTNFFKLLLILKNDCAETACKKIAESDELLLRKQHLCSQGGINFNRDWLYYSFGWCKWSCHYTGSPVSRHCNSQFPSWHVRACPYCPCWWRGKLTPSLPDCDERGTLHLYPVWTAGSQLTCSTGSEHEWTWTRAPVE